jgi:hypothetical protein
LILPVVGQRAARAGRVAVRIVQHKTIVIHFYSHRRPCRVLRSKSSDASKAGLHVKLEARPEIETISARSGVNWLFHFDFGGRRCALSR